MAVINNWSGSALDNNWDTGGNWSLGKPATVAAPNDHAVIIPAAVAGDSSHHITTGMDNESAVVLNSFTTERGSTVNVGVSTGLPLNIDTPVMKHFGSGKVYFKPVGTGAQNYCEVDSDAPTSDDALVFTGTATWEHLAVMKGRVTVDTNVTGLLNVSVGYRTNIATDALFVNNQPSASIVRFAQNGGASYFNTAGMAANGSMHISSGICYFQVGDAQMVVVTGGTFVFNSTTTLALAIVLGGVFDMKRTYANKTVTTMILGPGATLIRDDSIHAVTNLKLAGGKRL